MNHEELIEAVRQWGEAKGITGPNGTGTIRGQIEKLVEEFDELCEALDDQNVKEIIDALGDMQVVQTLLHDLLSAEFNREITTRGSLQEAYDVIYKRTGKMIDGQFVKD